jgi:hypothetical protein
MTLCLVEECLSNDFDSCVIDPMLKSKGEISIINKFMAESNNYAEGKVLIALKIN